MTVRLVLVAGLLVWAGATLLLAGWNRLARPSLSERLAPFHAGGGLDARRRTTRRVVGRSEEGYGTFVRDVGDRAAAFLGVRESAQKRLARIHSPLDAVTFRVRQAVATLAGGLVGALVGAGVGAPPALSAFLVAAAAGAVFLVVEQNLATKSDRWRRTTESEVPVVAEQLAMLLASGASLGSALHRLATRGRGCVAQDLQLVVNRVAQGLNEREALREWADRAGVEAVTRLVGVLTLHSEAADLGRLVTAEARRCRRDRHRVTLEQIERRGQQVWVPVTVATLVPGAILLAVPFVAALKLFGGT